MLNHFITNQTITKLALKNGKCINEFTKIILLFLCISFIGTLYAQKNISLEDKIPIDSSVSIGKLDNGLTYYLRYNKKPEETSFLRLVLMLVLFLKKKTKRISTFC